MKLTFGGVSKKIDKLGEVFVKKIGIRRKEKQSST